MTDEEVGLALPSAPPEPAVRVQPPKGMLSDAQVGLDDEFTRSISPGFNSEDALRAVDPQESRFTRGLARITAGNIGAFMDMITGGAAVVAGIPAYHAVNTFALAKGESPEVARQAAELAAGYFPESVKSPFRTIAEALGPRGVDAYERSPINMFMQWFSEGVEAGSEKLSEKTGMPAAYISDMANQAMSLLGTAAVKRSITRDIDVRTPGLDVTKPPMDFPAGAAEAPRSVVPRENPDPENMIPIYEEGKLSGWGPKDGRPFRQQMPEIPEAAEAATRTKQRLADVRAALKDEPTVKYRAFQADEAMMERAAPLIAEAEKNGRLTVTEAEAKGMPKLSEEVSHILNEIPAHQRTAEQLIKLREYNRRAFATQKGSVDPQHLLWLFAGTAAGMGGWKVGEAVYNYFQDKDPGDVAPLAAGLLPVIKGKSMKERLQARERAEFGEALRKEGRAAALRKYGGPLAAGTAAGYVGAELYKMATGEKTPEEKLRPKSDKLQDLALGVGVAAAAGAVKLKGGNWAEAAGTRLSASIYGDSARSRTGFHKEDLKLPDAELFKQDGSPAAVELRRDLKLDREFSAWTDKRVRDYLNRHAGTKEDPLKDVEIPFGEGTKDPHLKERGNIDIRTVGALAAVSGGAVLGVTLDDDSPLRGAALGAGAAGLLALRPVRKGLDVAFGRSSTRLAHIDPSLNRNVRDMEHSAAVAMSKASENIHAFVKEAKKLPAAAYTALQKAYMEGDPKGLSELIKGNPALVSGYREVRNFLDSIGDELRSFGRFGKGITDHLPRVVKDHKGLVESLGHTERIGLEKVLAEAETKTLQRRGRKLTDVERSILVNNFLFREPSSSYLPGFAKNRTIKMTDELQKFYYSMEEGLARYAHAAVEDVATAQFFGKDLRTSADGGKKFTHVDNSIGALTDRAMREGRMTPEDAVEVQKILRARFGPGELAPADWIQDVRNVTGIGTLGQIGSGLVQTSESLFSLYHHGLRPTIEATGMILTRRGISPKEFGLATHVIEETIGKRPTGQALNAVLKANLLAPLDQLGMKTNLTASFVKNRRLAQTPKGREKLERKWGEAYGEEFPELVRQLQKGERGPLTESLLWGELSDIRPASRIELPQLYNEHPNGRFLYQLKQFMLTQIDIIRRDAYDKIKSGKPREVAEGLKNLTIYATAMALATIPADAVKAWVSGRDFDFTKIDYVENMARYFGLNRYTMDKVSAAPAKGALEYGESMAKPPVLSVAERLAKGVDKPKELVPLIPLVGRPLYDRFFGGNDARAVAEAKRERLNTRNQRERANPELKERRLERLRRRAEKKAWKDAR